MNWKKFVKMLIFYFSLKKLNLSKIQNFINHLSLIIPNDHI